MLVFWRHACLGFLGLRTQLKEPSASRATDQTPIVLPERHGQGERSGGQRLHSNLLRKPTITFWPRSRIHCWLLAKANQMLFDKPAQRSCIIHHTLHLGCAYSKRSQWWRMEKTPRTTVLSIHSLFSPPHYFCLRGRKGYFLALFPHHCP